MPAAAAAETEVVLSRALHYPAGFTSTVAPDGCCAVTSTPFGLSLAVTDPAATPLVNVRVERAARKT